MNTITLTKGFEFWDEDTGSAYRVIEKHFNDFYCEKGIYNDETQEIEWTGNSYILTKHDIKSKTHSQKVIDRVDEEEEENQE